SRLLRHGGEAWPILEQCPSISFGFLPIKRNFPLSPALLRAERFLYWFPYRVSVRILDTAFGIFRTRLGLFSGHGFRRAVSSFWTWVSSEIRLESEVVARRFLPPGALVAALLATDQAGAFQRHQMLVQRRSRHLTAIGQILLRREAPVRRVMAIGQVPKHDLRGRLQAALRDGPVGGGVAH